MLILEFAILPKNSKNIASKNNIKLKSIHQATRINNIVKYSRMLNTTKSLLNNGNKIDILNTNKIKSNEEKVIRPKGRPRKDKLQKSTLQSNVSLQTQPNLLDKFNDASSYLTYASYKSLIPTSGVFIGNLYELQVKKCLEESFKIRSTLHQGGSNDKGIDINAIWEPAHIFEKTSQKKKSDVEFQIENVKSSSTKFEIVNSKKIKPLMQRTKQTLKLFVQCKCYDTSKIDPKLIREIKGSCQEYFKKNGNSAVFMLASTNGFTRTGKEDFDKATIPLIYVKFSKPKLINSKLPYDVNSWEMGVMMGMYLNPLATALFKGLDWIKFTNRLSA